MLSLKTLEQALATRAGKLIDVTINLITASVQPDKIKDNELFAQNKLEMIKMHMQYLLFHIFVEETEKQQFKDPRIKPIMEDLAKVHALR